MKEPQQGRQGKTTAWLVWFGAAVAIGLSAEVATPRVPTLATGLGVLCAVAGLAVLVTAAVWLRRGNGSGRERRGFVFAVGALLLITAVSAILIWQLIGLRSLTT
jgi:hypothetical protein